MAGRRASPQLLFAVHLQFPAERTLLNSIVNLHQKNYFHLWLWADGTRITATNRQALFVTCHFMFDHIDHIADKIIRERICNFDNLKDGFKRTLPKTRERFRRTDDEIVNSTADDLYFHLDFLKSELDALLLLLNPKGVRIFLDKLKQKLSYLNANQLTADIKLAILEGKEIKPKEKPDVFAYIDSSFVLPYYEGVELDFDIEALTTQIATIWLDFLSKVNELVTQLETEYLSGNQTKDDDILVLKPTLWGMSLNLNKIWKKYLNSKNGR